MKITSRQVEGVTVLDMTGRFTIGIGDVAVRNSVHEALESGAQRILLNLKNVTAVDSSGVGELVSAYARASNRGTKIKLVNLPEKVQDILTITQLITVFDVFDDEAEAVASF
ncbi:STAS domain-containing protein [Streptomyces sp. NPDC000410]|uniref:STAS domain-containing protein n=1 Tax=Streptomyces sp. NPDC000410 TaxID=3154254 RepID=UPI003332F8A6